MFGEVRYFVPEWETSSLAAQSTQLQDMFTLPKELSLHILIDHCRLLRCYELHHIYGEEFG